MTKITIMYEDDFGDSRTFTRTLPSNESMCVGDYFECALAAYDSFGYVNDIDVNIYGLGGSVVQTISWDKDNYITNTEPMDAADDLMSFLEQGCEVRRQCPVENWFMGHRY